MGLLVGIPMLLVAVVFGLFYVWILAWLVLENLPIGLLVIAAHLRVIAWLVPYAKQWWRNLRSMLGLPSLELCVELARISWPQRGRRGRCRGARAVARRRTRVIDRVDSGATVACLHDAWFTRTPIVVDLQVDPATFRNGESRDGDVWSLSPDLELPADSLQLFYGPTRMTLAQRRAATTTRAARELVKGGLSVREAGQVLGLSFQRVSQLTAGRS
ncbi:MAG: hypothetical protein H0U92_01500 [Actinobacteria bacterium]|nr:hypothetical protein [Actinomycetota bacterium]